MKRTFILLAVLSLLASALAGCVGTETDDSGEDPGNDVTPDEPGDQNGNDPGEDPEPVDTPPRWSLAVHEPEGRPDASWTGSPDAGPVNATAPFAATVPGAATMLAVTVENPGDANATALVGVEPADDIVPGEPVSVTVPAGGNTTAFLTVTVAEDASPGPVDVTVSVAGVPGEGDTTATVSVLDPDVAGGVQEEDGVSALFVGRLADGRVFNTNVPAYDGMNIARSPEYQASVDPLTLFTGSRANVPPSFAEGLIGMREGETRSITLPPEEAFGPATFESEEDRRRVIERTFTMEVEEYEERVDVLDTYLNDTGQGRVEDYDVGDTFLVHQQQGPVTFRILDLADGNVTYAWAAEEGDTLTLPEVPWWPNSTEVVSVDEGNVTLYTTPGTDVGEPFTYHDYWANMSAVESVNETHVVIVHNPEEGLEYVQTDAYGSPRTARVLAVEEDVIRVENDSPHPLAGKTVIFDVHALEILSGEEG